MFFHGTHDGQLVFLFCCKFGDSDHEAYTNNNITLTQKRRVKSLQELYHNTSAWLLPLSTNQTITFKTVSLSSLWFYLIYCTWNLISSWRALAFFHTLVIHVLSFSSRFSILWLLLEKSCLSLSPIECLRDAQAL